MRNLKTYSSPLHFFERRAFDDKRKSFEDKAEKVEGTETLLQPKGIITVGKLFGKKSEAIRQNDEKNKTSYKKAKKIKTTTTGCGLEKAKTISVGVWQKNGRNSVDINIKESSRTLPDSSKVI